MSREGDGVSIEDGTIIAVDTGGTFTDVVALIRGRVSVLKIPSTPDDPARAVLDGIRAVLADPDGDTAFTLVHGSTVATNTLLERTGARVALVTNAGFEDVIEIGRQNRPQLYAVVGHRPPPLVDREDRHGIAGRLGPDGQEEEALDEDELRTLAARLTAPDTIESVAVCLLHSYASPEHEERVADALAGIGLPVSVSSRLLPEFREFERTATTVVNAYVAPRIDRYLGRLAGGSGAERVRVMGSGGGAIPVERARREAVHTVLSGPAGGVAGALRVARDEGVGDILTFDMGGTSTDVSLCPGEPLHTREFTIAGVPVAIPVIDIHTVGAGGGSIADVDAGGALRVGPRSAGADPGPICYGRGGSRVTVTDANVWLGRLPADAFLGGDTRLDRAAVEAPLRALGDALGATPEEAAEGILEIANTAMEGALRVISVERGHDPADFTLVPFGGAAGLHVVELAHRLGIGSILVPPDPGVLSAYGMLVSPVRKDVSRTLLARPADDDRIRSAYEELEEEARAAMRDEGVGDAEARIRRFADVRYAGQSFELRIPFEDADAWAAAFHAAHETRYGFARPGAEVELVTARVEAVGPEGTAPGRAGTASPAGGSRGTGETAGETTGERDARRGHAGASGGGRREVEVWHGGGVVQADAVPRSSLGPGDDAAGPAVVHEYSATLWIPPGWCVVCKPTGALRVEPD